MAQKVIIYHMKDTSMLATMVQTISKYIDDCIQNDTMTNIATENQNVYAMSITFFG